MRELTPSEREIVDRYGELKRQVDAFKPIEDECISIAKKILSWCENEPAEKALLLEGNAYTVPVSAREFERAIFDLWPVFKYLGSTKFLELAKMGLSIIDQHIPETEHKNFLTRERTGRRTLKAIPKAPIEVVPVAERKSTRKKVAA